MAPPRVPSFARSSLFWLAVAEVLGLIAVFAWFSDWWPWALAIGVLLAVAVVGTPRLIKWQRGRKEVFDPDDDTLQVGKYGVITAAVVNNPALGLSTTGFNANNPVFIDLQSRITIDRPTKKLTLAVVGRRGGNGKSRMLWGILQALLFFAYAPGGALVEENPNGVFLDMLGINEENAQHNHTDLLKVLDSIKEQMDLILHTEPTDFGAVALPINKSAEMTPDQFEKIMQIFLQYFSVVFIDAENGLQTPTMKKVLEQVDIVVNVIMNNTDSHGMSKDAIATLKRLEKKFFNVVTEVSAEGIGPNALYRAFHIAEKAGVPFRHMPHEPELILAPQFRRSSLSDAAQLHFGEVAATVIDLFLRDKTAMTPTTPAYLAYVEARERGVKVNAGEHRKSENEPAAGPDQSLSLGLDDLDDSDLDLQTETGEDLSTDTPTDQSDLGDHDTIEDISDPASQPDPNLGGSADTTSTTSDAPAAPSQPVASSLSEHSAFIDDGAMAYMPGQFIAPEPPVVPGPEPMVVQPPVPPLPVTPPPPARKPDPEPAPPPAPPQISTESAASSGATSPEPSGDKTGWMTIKDHARAQLAADDQPLGQSAIVGQMQAIGRHLQSTGKLVVVDTKPDRDALYSPEDVSAVAPRSVQSVH